MSKTAESKYTILISQNRTSPEQRFDVYGTEAAWEAWSDATRLMDSIGATGLLLDPYFRVIKKHGSDE